MEKDLRNKAAEIIYNSNFDLADVKITDLIDSYIEFGNYCIELGKEQGKQEANLSHLRQQSQQLKLGY